MEKKTISEPWNHDQENKKQSTSNKTKEENNKDNIGNAYYIETTKKQETPKKETHSRKEDNIFALYPADKEAHFFLLNTIKY